MRIVVALLFALIAMDLCLRHPAAKRYLSEPYCRVLLSAFIPLITPKK